MVFSSIIFLLVFLPIFILSYFATPRKLRNYVLLAFSVFFYAWGAPWFIFFLLSSTVINFYLVQWMYQSSQKFYSRLFLGLSILVNVGLLLYFKYANFFMENVNYFRDWMHLTPLEWSRIMLPIGISFFTFQSITYSMDVYRKVHSPLKNPFDYMLYIMMFPQMIAGPIVRFQTIADQITDRRERWDEFLYGFYRFSIGLAKKVLIADVLGAQVNKILAQNIAEMDASMAWIGILGYTFQLYFDFSGYSDMAIGIGRMLGFKFPENFNNPYVSRSITEFWRRWHMTLGAWMKDYLYIPLGGSRVKSTTRLYFNLGLVFLVSGLWHGASWSFVLWGAYHGIFLILDRIFLLRVLEKLGKFPSVAITFFLAVMGWVMFRIEDFHQSILFYKTLFSFDFQKVDFSGQAQFFVILLIAALFSFITLFRPGLKLQEKFFFSEYSPKQHIAYWLIAVLLCVLSIAALTGTGFSPFIYFRF